MIKGIGEVLTFDWKNGQGIIHRKEFFGCAANCPDVHQVSFNWRQALRGKIDVDEGTVVAYTAHPKGEDIARAQTVSPTWGI
ncbi:MAG: hypothetical protein Q8R12_01460 [bacterium]|nr:hypothetical protein [bacterium]